MRHNRTAASRKAAGFMCCLIRATGFAALATTLALPAQGGGDRGSAPWTRKLRPGGETWTRTFIVTAPRRDAASRGTPSAQLDATAPIAQPVSAAGAAGVAAGVDIEARRAFLRTGPSSGTEVTTPAVDDQVYLVLAYGVTGPGGPIAISGRALIDNVERCRGTSDDPPGTYERWCNAPWTATVGPHTLRWELDVQNTVTETNESNNAASASWNTGIGLDFVARKAYLRTGKNSGDVIATPTVGQSVYPHLEYSVINPDTLVPFGIRALIDGEVICSGTDNGEPGDWVRWCVNPWVTTAGAHALRWELDYENQVREILEGDNTASVSWTSGGQPCVADCNRDGIVTIDDLITAINIAVDPTRLSTCPSADVNADHQVDIDEIIQAVNAALGGC